jgi:hypothetical protein
MNQDPTDEESIEDVLLKTDLAIQYGEWENTRL